MQTHRHTLTRTKCEPVSLATWSISALPPESVEKVFCDREEGLQREVRDLEQRCQAAEARHQDLAANIPEATRPLLRQLEAMQVIICPTLPVRKSLTAVKLYRCVLPLVLTSVARRVITLTCFWTLVIHNMQPRRVGMEMCNCSVFLLPVVQSTISDCHSMEKCTWWNALAHMKEEFCHMLKATKWTCAVYLPFANRANLLALSVYSSWQSYCILNWLLPTCGASLLSSFSTQNFHVHCFLTA